MKRTSLRIFLFAAAALPGWSMAQNPAQNPAIIQSPSDLTTLRTLVDEVMADPENPKSRRLLQQLVQEKMILQHQDVQKKREEALEQGLKLSGELGASAETSQELIHALEAINPQAFKSFTGRIAQMRAEKLGEVKYVQDMFVKLLREALRYYELGQQEEGFVTLMTALTLHPTLPGAIASAVKARQTAPPQRPHLVKAATQAPAAPAAPSGYYKLISPEESALAQQHFRSGIRFYSGGKLEEAAGSFREALAHDPNNEWMKKSLERTLAELKLKPAETRPEAKKAGPPPAPEKPAAAPEAPPAPVETRPTGEGMPYTTQRGDSLWKLAKRFYGTAFKWRLIQDANPQLKGRAGLPAGITIAIPQVATVSAESQAQPKGAVVVEGPREHVVGKGDNLWKLAVRYYGDANQWEAILKANPQIKDENRLEKGTALVIPVLPKAASRAPEKDR